MTNNHVRRRRIERGLTLMGLAVKAGSVPSYLVFIEKYGHTPGVDLRDRLATALETTEEELWPDLRADQQDGGSHKEGRRHE